MRDGEKAFERRLNQVSRAKLAQMVIQMFVHAAAPLLRRERAKEWMRVPGTSRFSACVKLSQLLFEVFLFAKEIPLI